MPTATSAAAARRSDFPTVRATTARQLVRPTVRAVRWSPLAAAALLGLLVVAVPAALVELQPDGWANVLRLAALAGATGAAFILDDPSYRSTVVVPTSHLLRRNVRVALLIPLAALWWTAVLLTLRTISSARTSPDPDALTGLPLGGLTLEAAALFAIAVAAAAIRTGGDGGITGAIATVVAALLTRLPQLDLVLVPGDPQWARAHILWALLTAAALFVYLTPGRRSGLP